MARGMTWAQIGVSEAMIATYGDAVWERSNNVQIRRGDPIRNLNFDAIARDRAELGMSDQQIAAEIGLSRDQVQLIRCILEARAYRRRNYHRLSDLGGNRRFRVETYVPHEDRESYSDHALAIRNTLRVDPRSANGYIADGTWANDTLHAWLSDNVARHAHRPALTGQAEALSFAELAQAADRLAGHFYRLGLRKGDVVSVQLPNIPEFFIVYLAATRLGALMSTVHMPYRTDDTRTLLAHARPRLFVCMSEIKDYAPAAEVLRMRAVLPDLAHIVTLGDFVAGTQSLSTLLATEASAPVDHAPVAADPFLLLFTSGTSASPKAVPLTYQMILGNARKGAVEHQLREDDVILSAAPYTHLLGLYSIHLALRARAACLLMPVFSPEEMLALVEKSRPTVLFTAPAHLATLLNGGLLQHADLSSLRLVIVSGSACPPDLIRSIAKLLPNGRITQLWGMTELQAGIYTRPDDPIELVANSAGRPCPGIETRVVDADGRVQPAGSEGELQIRGSSVFPGYFGNDDANRNAFTDDGWFRTGDLATIDANGNVRITGRLKEVINRGGVKYNPLDIENLISSHPKILQAAIVSYPDPVLGERACCFAVLRPNERLSLNDLATFLAEKGVSTVKLPERLEVIDELPMTPTRKVIKGRLRAMLLDAMSNSGSND